MRKNKETKISAILPAYNEEKTIANVLKILLEAKSKGILDEVIVVCSGSTDRTCEIAQNFGAKVIDSSKRAGKAQAMQEGLFATDAEIIAFFDGDLIGLKLEHILQLINPILEEKADMVVGVRDRIGETPIFLLKIDPLLAFGGERALKRFIFENVPEKFKKGFAIETALNCYCQVNKLSVKFVKLKGLKMVVKEKKMGFLKGLWERVKMMWQMLKIRIDLFFSKKEFKIKK